MKNITTEFNLINNKTANCSNENNINSLDFQYLIWVNNDFEDFVSKNYEQSNCSNCIKKSSIKNIQSTLDGNLKNHDIYIDTEQAFELIYLEKRRIWKNTSLNRHIIRKIRADFPSVISSFEDKIKNNELDDFYCKSEGERREIINPLLIKDILRRYINTKAKRIFLPGALIKNIQNLKELIKINTESYKKLKEKLGDKLFPVLAIDSVIFKEKNLLPLQYIREEYQKLKSQALFINIIGMDLSNKQPNLKILLDFIFALLQDFKNLYVKGGDSIPLLISNEKIIPVINPKPIGRRNILKFFKANKNQVKKNILYCPSYLCFIDSNTHCANYCKKDKMCYLKSSKNNDRIKNFKNSIKFQINTIHYFHKMNPAERAAALESNIKNIDQNSNFIYNLNILINYLKNINEDQNDNRKTKDNE